MRLLGREHLATTSCDFDPAARVSVSKCIGGISRRGAELLDASTGDTPYFSMLMPLPVL